MDKVFSEKNGRNTMTVHDGSPVIPLYIYKIYFAAILKKILIHAGNIWYYFPFHRRVRFR